MAAIKAVSFGVSFLEVGNLLEPELLMESQTCLFGHRDHADHRRRPVAYG
jgi:hypothetical protein